MSHFFADKRVVVTGGAGFLGRFVVAGLRARGCRDVIVPRSRDYDLTEMSAVRKLYDDAKPDLVIHLAAQVGGIGANRENPGKYFYDNLMMGVQLIEEGRRHKLPKLVAAGTICAYPKFTPVPFKE
ncbi:MAG TPA: NAD-dependent epimerase/dehydratase family protein, partial [Polyangia bacterium]|nr:NAD-dependent epimerase/dehydratase family protein [Polyangia bacterium]